MMNKKNYIIFIFLLSGMIASGQESCKKQYEMIHEMANNSNRILRNEELSLAKRIRQSKKISKEALKLGYKTLEENDCKKYSIIVDRIIDLELKLGNKSKAEEIALKRLNKLNPNWKYNSPIKNSSHLSILARISSLDKSNTFYKKVRKNKGSYGVCGTTTYEEDVSRLLWQAEKLFVEYGKVYCLNFLQASTIIINEDKEKAKLSWDKIYDLLIKSMTIKYTYEQIKNQYENSIIKNKKLEEWERLIWEFNFQKSQYYLEVGENKFFFKTEKCSDEINEYKRCQPVNCDLLKIKSDLYKKIKEYASE